MAKKEPNPAIKTSIDLYHDLFKKRFGFKPVIHGGKDGSHFQKLIATWGAADVEWLIKEFFRTTDPRIVRSDYTVGALFGLAQHLMLKRSGHKNVDDRTAHNLDAAARATGRR